MAINTLKNQHKKDMIIYPEKIDFGVVDRGGIFRTKLIIRNNQNLMQRVNVRPPLYNPHISIINAEGPIAPGLSKVIGLFFVNFKIVHIHMDTSEIMERTVREEIRVITKKFTYTVPIVAIINSLSSERNQDKNEELYSDAYAKKCNWLCVRLIVSFVWKEPKESNFL
jgi:hypothetical protein